MTTDEGEKDDGGSSSGDGDSETTRKSEVGEEREVRGGKNCIRSNHVRERHRVLRNQLNGERLAVEGDSSGRRMEGVKEREKKSGRVGRISKQTALSSG